MPFVIMCGLPSSGKSTRAHQLSSYLQENHNKSVTVIDEDSLQIQKNEVYADSKKEKNVRAALKSAVQRKISKEDVVILDSLNYIKGYRYELHCVTKAGQTPSCTIHCDINPDQASEWNQKRPEQQQYSQEVLDALCMRFEPPNSQHRWDSPLFLVQPDDELPFEQIYNALYLRMAPPPNLSTQIAPLSSTNFLHELDKITQAIVHDIVDAQKTALPGDQIKVSGATDKVVLSRTLTLGELQRMRRQFITYTKMHPVEDCAKLANMFVQYLNNSLQ